MSTKKERMYKAIHQHGLDLLAIFPNAIEKDPVKLYKKLFSLENKAHRLAEDYCNGAYDCETIDEQIMPILARVSLILFGGVSKKTSPVFFNGDCRGYALKINETFIQGKNISRNFGGYAILAPDFRKV